MQDDRERLVSVYGRLMRMVFFFVIPVLTLFALLTEPFIRLLLTEKWVPVIPLIQWLCFARMITPISSLNMNILNTIGRSDLFFKVDVLKVPLSIIALIITIPLGLKAVVIGHFITTLFNFFINAYYPGKIFGFGAVKQIKEMKLTVYATIIMVFCVFLMMRILHNDFLTLLICTPFGLIIYFLASYLMKNEEVDEIAIMSKTIYAKIK
jgi:O-antigen/teichoic acid export membrane protein